LKSAEPKSASMMQRVCTCCMKDQKSSICVHDPTWNILSLRFRESIEAYVSTKETRGAPVKYLLETLQWAWLIGLFSFPPTFCFR
jgi:hypothetical protein